MTPNLKTLNLSRTATEDDANDIYCYHVHLAKLESLSLNRCYFHDNFLVEYLMMCGPLLKELNLSGTTISGEGVGEYSYDFPNLEFLKLNRCHELTDAGFCVLMKAIGLQLKSLSLKDTNITGIIYV